jgi:hypothetical protein
MAGMTESDERLEAVGDKIDDAKAAAKVLAEHDVIDPDAVEGAAPNSVDAATDDADPAHETDQSDADQADDPVRG